MPGVRVLCRGSSSKMLAAGSKDAPDEAVVLLEALDKAALPRPAGLRVGPHLPSGANLQVHQGIETKQPV